MGVLQFCVSSGRGFRETVGGPCCSSVPTAIRPAVTSTVGNGIAFRDGQIESGGPIGVAGRVTGCATLPKVAISVEAGVERWPPYFALTETYRARSNGFLTFLRLMMIPRLDEIVGQN